MSTSSSSDTSGAAPDTRSLLRDMRFLRLWIGTTASGFAAWALPFVLGLAVLDRSLTAASLGVVLATRTLGFLAAVPMGGVLADRYSRRRVVLWSAAAAAVSMPAIAIGLGSSTAIMAMAAAVAGAGHGACRPAFQGLTAETIEPARLQSANAAMTLAVRVTTLLAPGVTALLATVVDTPALLLLIAVAWLLAALVPPTSTDASPTRARSSFFAQFVDGAREARRHPWFMAGLTALTAVITTGYSATGVALPLVSREKYGTEAVLAGALTAYTVGALLGAILLARWRPRSRGWVALAGLASYGFAPLGLLLPVPPTAIFAAYVVAGVGIELFNVPWLTACQREVPPEKVSRVASLDFLLSYGLAPAGLALIAPTIDLFGTGTVLGACALVCFVVPVVAGFVPTVRHFSQGNPDALKMDVDGPVLQRHQNNVGADQ